MLQWPVDVLQSLARLIHSSSVATDTPTTASCDGVRGGLV